MAGDPTTPQEPSSRPGSLIKPRNPHSETAPGSSGRSKSLRKFVLQPILAPHVRRWIGLPRYRTASMFKGKCSVHDSGPWTRCAAHSAGRSENFGPGWACLKSSLPSGLAFIGPTSAASRAVQARCGFRDAPVRSLPGRRSPRQAVPPQIHPLNRGYLLPPDSKTKPCGTCRGRPAGGDPNCGTSRPDEP